MQQAFTVVEILGKQEGVIVGGDSKWSTAMRGTVNGRVIAAQTQKGRRQTQRSRVFSIRCFVTVVEPRGAFQA